MIKIFISWSGESSHSLAEIFREWLPSILQTVKPYFSPNDIDKGLRWSSEVAQELNASNIGIICITPDNIKAPWILFEAGALSKLINDARVCPILFGLNPTDVDGPLAQFQCTPFSKDEIKKLVKVINGFNIENTLEAKALDTAFEVWWPHLKERVDTVLGTYNPKAKKVIRSERELLEEILTDVRVLKQGVQSSTNQLSNEALLSPLDPQSAQSGFSPLFMQIRNNIREEIRRGEWEAGEKLPNGLELAARYRVSQGTIRKALEDLEVSDEIIRTPDGTYRTRR